jgi:hypothetical protein
MRECFCWRGTGHACASKHGLDTCRHQYVRLLRQPSAFMCVVLLPYVYNAGGPMCRLLGGLDMCAFTLVEGASVRLSECTLQHWATGESGQPQWFWPASVHVWPVRRSSTLK